MQNDQGVESIVLISHCTSINNDLTQFEFKGFCRGRRIKNIVGQSIPQVEENSAYLIHATINCIISTTLFVSVHKCKPIN